MPELLSAKVYTCAAGNAKRGPGCGMLDGGEGTRAVRAGVRVGLSERERRGTRLQAVWAVIRGDQWW